MRMAREFERECLVGEHFLYEGVEIYQQIVQP